MSAASSCISITKAGASSPALRPPSGVTTIKCHGKLVSDTASQMKGAVKPLIPLRGRIVIDLGDVTYLDSSGLGTLVGLKASAINQGLCILEFANMTPRVMDLLRITRLTQMFSS